MVSLFNIIIYIIIINSIEFLCFDYLLVDINDELICVEELVRRYCFSPNKYREYLTQDMGMDTTEDIQDSGSPRASKLINSWNNSDVEAVILEGGWQGFHCETTIINSLFSVFMFDLIFLSKRPSGEDAMDTNDAENHEKDTFDIRDMFITPLQDHPLDMMIASNSMESKTVGKSKNMGFYIRRQREIEDRLSLLSKLNSTFIISDEDLLIDEETAQIESYDAYFKTLEGVTDPLDYRLSLSRFFSFSFRHNYKSQCIGLSWSYPMAALQLVPVCIGSFPSQLLILLSISF